MSKTTTTDRPTEAAPKCCRDPEHDGLRRKLEWIEPEVARVRDERDALARESEEIADRIEQLVGTPDAKKDFRGLALAQRELASKQEEAAAPSGYLMRLDNERGTIIRLLRECALEHGLAR